MKSLGLMLAGILTGVIATVMFFSVDATFENAGNEGPGGGNARMSLDQEALAALVQQQISALEAFGPDARVVVRIEPQGLIDVDITIGAAPVGVPWRLVLDPEVVEERLELVLVEGDLGDFGDPQAVSDLIRDGLRAQLDALAGGLPYGLTSITTTDERVTLEIKIAV